MPIRMLITEGARADFSQAEHLIEGIDAEYLLADKGYDSDKLIKKRKKEE
jgi:IS5 family transposase